MDPPEIEEDMEDRFLDMHREALTSAAKYQLMTTPADLAPDGWIDAWDDFLRAYDENSQIKRDLASAMLNCIAWDYAYDTDLILTPDEEIELWDKFSEGRVFSNEEKQYFWSLVDGV